MVVVNNHRINPPYIPKTKYAVRTKSSTRPGRKYKGYNQKSNNFKKYKIHETIALPTPPHPAQLHRVVRTSPRRKAAPPAVPQRVIYSVSPLAIPIYRITSPKVIPTWNPSNLVDDPPTTINASVAFAYTYSAVEEILNLNDDGASLTKKSALTGCHRHEWQLADSTEIRKLFDTGTMHPAHLKNTNNQKPTYYKPVYKEKHKYDGLNNSPQLLRRVRGSIGDNFLCPTNPTSANTAEMEVIKVFMNSVVSDNANMAVIDIKDFYLRTDLPPGEDEYMWIDGQHFAPELIAEYKLQPFVAPFHGFFRIVAQLAKDKKILWFVN